MNPDQKPRQSISQPTQQGSFPDSEIQLARIPGIKTVDDVIAALFSSPWAKVYLEGRSFPGEDPQPYIQAKTRQLRSEIGISFQFQGQNRSDEAAVLAEVDSVIRWATGHYDKNDERGFMQVLLHLTRGLTDLYQFESNFECQGKLHVFFLALEVLSRRDASEIFSVENVEYLYAHAMSDRILQMLQDDPYRGASIVRRLLLREALLQSEESKKIGSDLLDRLRANEDWALWLQEHRMASLSSSMEAFAVQP